MLDAVEALFVTIEYLAFSILVVDGILLYLVTDWEGYLYGTGVLVLSHLVLFFACGAASWTFLLFGVLSLGAYTLFLYYGCKLAWRISHQVIRECGVYPEAVIFGGLIYAILLSAVLFHH